MPDDGMQVERGDPHERGLARSVRAEQNPPLARRDRPVDAVEDHVPVAHQPHGGEGECRFDQAQQRTARTNLHISGHAEKQRQPSPGRDQAHVSRSCLAPLDSGELAGQHRHGGEDGEGEDDWTSAALVEVARGRP